LKFDKSSDFKKDSLKKQTTGKKRNEKEKTAYVMFGCGPVSNPGHAGCAATASAPTSSVDSTSRV
jgi:hypothetical protein